MSELLPLFPLGAVLFPGALMPLHIFEPRYRLLIRRCIERQRHFGIVLIRNGPEVGDGAEPYEVGTEAKIVAESPLPDGRSYIVTRGERRFVVESLVADAEPYLMGQVRYLDETDGDRAVDRAGVAREALGAYLLAVVAVTDDARGERALADDLRNAPRAISRTGSPEALRWTRLSSRLCSSWRPRRLDSRKRRGSSIARPSFFAISSCGCANAGSDRSSTKRGRRRSGRLRR